MTRIAWSHGVGLMVIATLTWHEFIHAVEPATMVAVACGAATCGFVVNEVRHRLEKARVDPERVFQQANQRFPQFGQLLHQMEARDVSLGIHLLSEPEEIIRKNCAPRFENVYRNLQELHANVQANCQCIKDSLRLGNFSSGSRVQQQLERQNTQYLQLLNRLQVLAQSATRTQEVLQLHKTLKEIADESCRLPSSARTEGEGVINAIIAHVLTHKKSLGGYLRTLEKMSQDAGAATRRLRELEVQGEMVNHAQEFAGSLKQRLIALQERSDVIEQLRRERGISINELNNQLREAQARLEQVQREKRQVRNRLSTVQQQFALAQVSAQRATVQDEQRCRDQLNRQRRELEIVIESLQKKFEESQADNRRLRQQLQGSPHRPLQSKDSGGPLASGGSLPVPLPARLSGNSAPPPGGGPLAGPGLLHHRR